LNFLARVTPDAPCDPDCSGLTATDTFTTRVYPRNEFVQTIRIKTIRKAVTAPPPAGVDRVSRNDFATQLSSGDSIASNCKAQTSSYWRLRSAKIGGLKQN